MTGIFLAMTLALKAYAIICLGVIAFMAWRLHLPETEVKNAAKKFFWSVFWVSTALVIWLVLNQYILWQSEIRSRYFLPPYQPLEYFLYYSWSRFIKPEAFSFGLACFFFLVFWSLQKISRQRVFYADEVYSAGIGFLLVGWPQGIILIVLALASGVIWGLLRRFIVGRSDPSGFYISTRFFWLFWSVFLVGVGRSLVDILGLTFLRL